MPADAYWEDRESLPGQIGSNMYPRSFTWPKKTLVHCLNVTCGKGHEQMQSGLPALEDWPFHEVWEGEGKALHEACLLHCIGGLAESLGNSHDSKLKL